MRAKIDLSEQINQELKKIYRLQRNKQITLADAKSLRELLIALRNGLPTPVEAPRPIVSTLTITTVEEGSQFACGVLMPFEMARAAVAEAAVIGIPHPKWAERPLLVMVRKEGQDVSRDEVLDFLRGKVAKWWLPDDVLFVDSLPHTATGKLSKLTLRAQLKDYRWPAADSAGT